MLMRFPVLNRIFHKRHRQTSKWDSAPTHSPMPYVPIALGMRGSSGGVGGGMGDMMMGR